MKLITQCQKGSALTIKKGQLFLQISSVNFESKIFLCWQIEKETDSAYLSNGGEEQFSNKNE